MFVSHHCFSNVIIKEYKFLLFKKNQNNNHCGSFQKLKGFISQKQPRQYRFAALIVHHELHQLPYTPDVQEHYHLPREGCINKNYMYHYPVLPISIPIFTGHKCAFDIEIIG